MSGSLIHSPIAITGVACRLPAADNLSEFWKLLVGGGDAITEIPEDRLERSLYFDPQKGVRGKTYSQIGGMIPRRPLDPSLLPTFGSSYDDFDECHWIFAEVAARAWRDAGYTKPKRPTGVYIGHSGGSRRPGDLVYASLAEQTADLLRDIPAFQTWSRTKQNRVIQRLTELMREGRPHRGEKGKPYLDANAAARLVSETLGLTGPQFVLDAACASSLAALGLAALDLQSGVIDSAVVGGASYNKCDSLILFSQAQSCSSTGSRPFDEDADGLISSEGYIAVVLKTLPKALADGDRIRGVIRGLGISTDGRGKSLWAPRREGQLLAVQRAYSSKVRPESVQYVEAHATSTQIGDATETQALSDFFKVSSRNQKLPVGSVKSNIGHTLETAGLAGLLKTLLSMENGVIPATIHLEKLNQSIPWSELPFFVATKNIEWKRPEDRPRCGAVNAFGIGGLNVHVVLEQFDHDYHSQLGRGEDRGSSSKALRRFGKSGPSVGTSEPIAIIGRGVIVPGANGVKEFASLLANPVSQIGPPPEDRWRSHIGVHDDAKLPWNVPTDQAGYLREYAYDWRKHKVPPKQVDRANPLQFMLLDAAGQALEESTQGSGKYDSTKTSVVVGTVFGGEFGHQLQMGLRLVELRKDLATALDEEQVPASTKAELTQTFEERFLKANPALLDETGSFTSSTLASRITKQYNLMGGAMAVDASDGASMSALSASIGLLENGVSETVICAAAQRALDLPAFETLASKGWFGKEKDESRNPSEGVVVLVLKRLSDAKRDGNPIFGVLDSLSLESTAESSSTPTQLPLVSSIGDLQGAHGLLALLDATFQTDTKRSPVPFVFHSANGISYQVQLRQESQVTIPSTGVFPENQNGVRNRIQDQPKMIKSSGNPLPTPSIHSLRPRIALFPGQGSQSPQMLRYWVEHSSTARKTIEYADSILASLKSPPLEALLNDRSSVKSTWNTQAVMLIADSVIWEACQSPSSTIDAVAGHSLGELAALVASQAWSLSDALAFVRKRADAVDRVQSKGNPGGLLSIRTTSDEIENLLRYSKHPLFVTHVNAPNQCVVGGLIQHLSLFQKELQQKSIQSALLAVPAPFHSPLLIDASLELAESASQVAMLPPRIPFLSSVTNRFESDPDALRQILVKQLVTPIHFPTLMHRLHDMGAREFIEFGPGEVLLKLAQQNLGTEGLTYHASESWSQKVWNESVYTSSIELSSPKNSTERQAADPELDLTTFDATAARRSRKRNIAAGLDESRNGKGYEPRSIDGATPSKNGTSKNGSTKGAMPAVHGTDPALDRREEKHSAKNEGDASRFPVALETFLRDFIVEQTGYPPEMVQLDWDLEADLGIDSIKLAQLIGELREMFDVDPTSLMSSNVRTLRQILEILNDAGGKREWLEDSPVLESRSGNVPPMQPTTKPEKQAVTHETDASSEHLSVFIADFVMEQTGYPRDIIDMDADFEADLGLDSIKMMQLFGELRGHFGYQIEQEDRSVLAKCRTLNQIIEHLTNVPRDGQSSPAEAIDSREIHSIDEEAIAVGVDEVPSLRCHGDCEETSVDCECRIGKSPEYVDGLALGKDFSRIIRESLYESSLRTTVSAIAERADRYSRGSFQHERLQGIADGAGVHLENIVGLMSRSDESDPLWTIWGDRSDIGTVEKKADPVDAFPEATVHSPEGITKRFLLRLVDSPIEDGERTLPTWNGPAVVYGKNATASLLAQRLRDSGLSVLELDSNQSPEHVTELFDEFHRDSSVPHLFLAHSLDEESKTGNSVKAWQARRDETWMGAFWLAQRWMKRNVDLGKLQNASLVGYAGLGGNFGFEGNLSNGEGGAITGLLKAIAIESWVNGFRGLPVKVIDVGPLDPTEVAVNGAFFELANPSYSMEISWAGGIRRTVRAVESPLEGIRKVASLPSGNWICTGGGRGITSFAAEAIANRFDLTLHLIGTAPVPNIDPEWRDQSGEGLRGIKNRVMHDAKMEGRNIVKAWQDAEKQIEIDATLSRLHSQGIRAHYYCCDVANANELSKVLKEIRSKHGPITGCLHGAGVGQDSRFDRKRPEKVQQCLAAKVDGARNLMQALQNDPIQYFVGFGSISGRFGANGHTDYSMANDALAKLVDWYRVQRPEVRAVTFHWHAWGDIGMATKPETKLALEMIDMQFMPASEGLQHLLSELEIGAPEREVMITDDRYYRKFYPAESILAPSQRPIDRSRRFALLSSEPIAEPGNLHRNVFDLDPTHEIFLKEHRLNKEPLLPFVVAMEAIAEGAISHRESKSKCDFPLVINRLEMSRGMRFTTDKSKRVSVLTKEYEGKITVQLTSDFYARDGKLLDADREYAKAEVEFGNVPSAETWTMPDLSRLAFQDAIYPDEDQALYVGPAFRVLKKFAIESDRVIGKIIAPSLIELSGHRRPAEGWWLPSAILDSCLFATGIWAWSQIRPGVCLPVGIERIKLLAMPSPGEPCVMESRPSRIEGRNGWFDFRLWGRHGKLLVETTGYKTAWLE